MFRGNNSSDASSSSQHRSDSIDHSISSNELTLSAPGMSADSSHSTSTQIMSPTLTEVEIIQYLISHCITEIQQRLSDYPFLIAAIYSRGSFTKNPTEENQQQGRATPALEDIASWRNLFSTNGLFLEDGSINVELASVGHASDLTIPYTIDHRAISFFDAKTGLSPLENFILDAIYGKWVDEAIFTTEINELIIERAADGVPNAESEKPNINKLILHVFEKAIAAIGTPKIKEEIASLRDQERLEESFSVQIKPTENVSATFSGEALIKAANTFHESPHSLVQMQLTSCMREYLTYHLTHAESLNQKLADRKAVYIKKMNADGEFEGYYPLFENDDNLKAIYTSENGIFLPSGNLNLRYAAGRSGSGNGDKLFSVELSRAKATIELLGEFRLTDQEILFIDALYFDLAGELEAQFKFFLNHPDRIDAISPIERAKQEFAFRQYLNKCFRETIREIGIDSLKEMVRLLRNPAQPLMQNSFSSTSTSTISVSAHEDIDESEDSDDIDFHVMSVPSTLHMAPTIPPTIAEIRDAAIPLLAQTPNILSNQDQITLLVQGLNAIETRQVHLPLLQKIFSDEVLRRLANLTKAEYQSYSNDELPHPNQELQSYGFNQPPYKENDFVLFNVMKSVENDLSVKYGIHYQIIQNVALSHDTYGFAIASMISALISNQTLYPPVENTSSFVGFLKHVLQYNLWTFRLNAQGHADDDGRFFAELPQPFHLMNVLNKLGPIYRDIDHFDANYDRWLKNIPHYAMRDLFEPNGNIKADLLQLLRDHHIVDPETTASDEAAKKALCRSYIAFFSECVTSISSSQFREIALQTREVSTVFTETRTGERNDVTSYILLADSAKDKIEKLVLHKINQSQNVFQSILETAPGRVSIPAAAYFQTYAADEYDAYAGSFGKSEPTFHGEALSQAIVNYLSKPSTRAMAYFNIPIHHRKTFWENLSSWNPAAESGFEKLTNYIRATAIVPFRLLKAAFFAPWNIIRFGTEYIPNLLAESFSRLGDTYNADLHDPVKSPTFFRKLVNGTKMILADTACLAFSSLGFVTRAITAPGDNFTASFKIGRKISGDGFAGTALGWVFGGLSMSITGATIAATIWFTAPTLLAAAPAIAKVVMPVLTAIGSKVIAALSLPAFLPAHLTGAAILGLGAGAVMSVAKKGAEKVKSVGTALRNWVGDWWSALRGRRVGVGQDMAEVPDNNPSTPSPVSTESLPVAGTAAINKGLGEAPQSSTGLSITDANQNDPFALVSDPEQSGSVHSSPSAIDGQTLFAPPSTPPSTSSEDRSPHSSDSDTPKNSP